MTADDAHAEILVRLRSRLTALAAAHDAVVDENSAFEGYGARGTRFLLRPLTPDATTVSLFPENAYSTWVEFGREVVDEIWTNPKRVEKAVEDVMEVVEAVAAGRARQRLWFDHDKPEPIGAEAWVQLQDGGKWVTFQKWGDLRRIFRRWYRAEEVRYAAYS